MRIIGIDPGSFCGWSVIDNDVRIASGVWALKGGRHEGGGMRYLRVQLLFKKLVADYHPDAVAYEIVRRHGKNNNTDAAHIYGGIIGQIATICEQEEIPFAGIEVRTAKRIATGKGNANKEAMVKAAQAKWDPSIVSDDEADALWMAYSLYQELC